MPALHVWIGELSVRFCWSCPLPVNERFCPLEGNENCSNRVLRISLFEKKNYIFEAISGITDRCSYLEKICIWQVVFHRKGGSLAWEISVFSMSSFSVMSRGNQDCQMTLWKRLLDTELAPRRDASLVSCFVWKNIRIWKSSLSRTSLSLTGLKHFFAEVNIFQAQADFLPREKFSCLAECATIH